MSDLASNLASSSGIPIEKWSRIEYEYNDVLKVFEKIMRNDGYFTNYTSEYVVPSIKLLDMPKDPNIRDEKVKPDKILLIFHQQHLQMEFQENRSELTDLVERYRKDIPTNCFYINKYNIIATKFVAIHNNMIPPIIHELYGASLSTTELHGIQRLYLKDLVAPYVLTGFYPSLTDQVTVRRQQPNQNELALNPAYEFLFHKEVNFMFVE